MKRGNVIQDYKPSTFTFIAKLKEAVCLQTSVQIRLSISPEQCYSNCFPIMDVAELLYMFYR